MFLIKIVKKTGNKKPENKQTKSRKINKKNKARGKQSEKSIKQICQRISVKRKDLYNLSYLERGY